MVVTSSVNLPTEMKKNLLPSEWDDLFEDARERWLRVRDRLIEMGTWKADWDGEGSPAPSKNAVSGAIRLVDHQLDLIAQVDIEMLPPPLRVLPTVDGTILFEWQNAHPKLYWELDVRDLNQAEGMIHREGSPVQHVEVVWE